MKNITFLSIAASLPLALVSCVSKETKPVGPVSNKSKIAWNQPVPGQGQGQFGMLPQNQYRR